MSDEDQANSSMDWPNALRDMAGLAIRNGTLCGGRELREVELREVIGRYPVVVKALWPHLGTATSLASNEVLWHRQLFRPVA